MLLAGGMLVGGSVPVSATTTPEPGERQAPVPQAPVEQAPADQAPVDQAPPAEQAPAQSAPADGAPAQPAPPTDAEPEPAPVPSTGLRYVGGFVANGGATTPTTFTPVLGDATYPVPEPPVNENLPAEVDELGDYQRKVSCDPQDSPGITAFAMLVFDHYNRPAYSGSRPCIDYNSFHHDGRALDWALSAHDPMDRRIADETLVWLTADDGEMASRFGIENIIWNHKVWDRRRGWYNYAGHPHDDHVHFAFTWDGAAMRTSWWTGVAVGEPDLGPCEVADGYAPVHLFRRAADCDPASPGLPRSMSAENGIGTVQELLGVERTGELDEATRSALLSWQMEHDLPVTGLADDLTYSALQGWTLPELAAGLQAALPAPWALTDFTPFLRTTVREGDSGPAVTVLQEAIGAEPDGAFGPKTAETLREWEETVPVLAIQAERRGQDAPAEVTPLTWTLLERATHPTISVRATELSEGSIDQDADPEGARAAQGPQFAEDGTEIPTYSGGAVTFLQTLLDVEADGIFGPLTGAAVAEVQEAAGLEPTGVVDGPTWAAIEEAAIEAELVPGAPGLQAQREREREAQEAKEAEEEAARQARAEEEAAQAFQEGLSDAQR